MINIWSVKILPKPSLDSSAGFALGWVVGGGIPMLQLVSETNLDLPRRAESVSSWFARELDRQVKVGDSLVWKNAEFFVRKIRRSQVWEFHLRRKSIL